MKNIYYIDNGGYNQNIGVGESVSIGFIINSGDSSFAPKDFRLNSVVNESQNSDDGEEETKNKERIEFNFSIDYEDFDYSQEINYYLLNTELKKIEGYVSPIDQISGFKYKVENNKGTIISKGNIAIKENWSIEDCELTYGSNVISISIIDINENVTEHKFRCYNNNTKNASEILENQGLVNQLVYEDTDKDGLYDFLEAEVMQMNPFDDDSDRDGICDSNEDFDSDGLTNLQEIEKEFDLLKEDTDEDGLKDGEEYNRLKTNVLEKDTDKDGASDQWEINNGYNPVKKETSFKNREVLELEGNIENVSVQIESEKGLAVETLSVEATENAFLNEDVPGYIGTAVEFLSEQSIFM